MLDRARRAASRNAQQQTTTMRIEPTVHARFALLLACLAGCATAPEPTAEDLRAWFAQPAATRGPAPDSSTSMTRAEAEAYRDLVVAACRDAKRASGADDLVPASTDATTATQGALRIGDFTMPYVLLQKGERPANGWPLWICLHGGGGNDQADGPHGWSVNTREWDAQKRLFAKVYSGAGLYFIPRMADDRRGRWWFDHNQIAFDEVIRKAILFRDVDPDRVYLMGISEGGYGAIRFAGNRPDRFAACGGMAAAEPLSTSPPENMRNVALRIDIGEKDTMFDRIGLARRMGERLAQLRAQDSSGYDHELNVQQGRGHGIDYSLTPKWLATKTRDARPSRVVWHVAPFDSQVELRSHWLALAERPSKMPLCITALRTGQRIEITATTDGATQGSDGTATQPADSSTLLLRLDDSMLDLDQPIEIVVNGETRPAVTARRSLATMARTMEDRWDPRTVFVAEIAVPLAPTASR